MKSVLSEDFLGDLGVIDFGYTEDLTPHSFDRFEQWIAQGKAEGLPYLQDERQGYRKHLKHAFPKVQSAIVFLFDYRPTKKWLLENNNHRIASYALGFGGADYHAVLKKRLLKILEKLKEQHPDLEGYVSLDHTPILERDLAYQAGLGWFGKNSMLISRKEGSYFLLGSLLLDRKLHLPKRPLEADFCGTCNACVDACPTNAIDPETRTLTANQCISMFTIEVMKEETPPVGFEKSRGEAFGCDICQDVCPWNRRPLENETPALDLKDYPVVGSFLKLPQPALKDFIEGHTGRGLKKLLEGTALARPGKRGWLKNLRPSPTEKA